MTRLLDRYVLGIFLPALLLFTVTLLFLFVAIDCAGKLGKFLEIQGEPVLPFMLRYYGYRIPMLLSLIIPAVMLFAPTFTVIKLARANELLPIATSGTSLRRVSLPFVVTAILGGGAMAALDEFVLPDISDKITDTAAGFGSRNVRFSIEDYDGKTKMWAQKFNMDTKLFSGGVRISQLDASMEPVEVVIAERCQWDPARKCWVAYNGTIEKPQKTIIEKGEKPRVWKEAIPPEGIVVTLRKDAGISTRQTFSHLETLLDDLKRNPHIPSNVLQVHTRFSFPLSPLVLVLVGLPFVMDPQSKSFVKGLIFCLLLSLGFYITHLGCGDLANKGSIPPLVGAWFPVASFGAAGIYSFVRMRT